MKANLIRSDLLSNVASLFIFQGTSYLLPILTLPYLVRVLGPDRFGLLAFAQAFIQYFVVLSDFGFNLTATRHVAIHRHDPLRLSKLFSTVMLIKSALAILALIVLSVVVFAIRKFDAERTVYFLTFMTVIGTVLFPLWFFQGMENMGTVLLPNLVAKGFAASLIFLLVRRESDYVLAAFLQSLGFLLSGLLGIGVVRWRFGIRFLCPSFREIMDCLKDGYHVFLSTSSTSLYTASNAFVLGLVSNNLVVGYYSAAEKIIRALLGTLTPITQAVYPHVNSLAVKSKEHALSFIGRVLKTVGVLTLIVSAMLFIFAEDLVQLVLGQNYKASTLLIQIMAPLPFIVVMSNMLGVQTLLTFGFSREFSRIVVLGALLNLFLLIPMSIAFQAAGVAASYLFTELFIMGLFFAFVCREKLHLRASLFSQ